MTLLEKAAQQAVMDYMSNKRTGPDKIGAIKYIRTICGVDLRTAMRALEVQIQNGSRE